MWMQFYKLIKKMEETTKEINTAKQLFSTRMLIKQLMQISFEAREIDKSFPSDYYEFNNAEKMLELYNLILDRILELSKDIELSR